MSKLYEKLYDLAIKDATIYQHLRMADNGMDEIDISIALIRSLYHEKQAYFEQARKLMETDVRPLVIPRNSTGLYLTRWERFKLWIRGL